MDGFGSHTFQWVNAKGERSWVKFHFKTDQGIRCLTNEESARVGGENPQHHQQDLRTAIERGEHPSWTLKVQVMPDAAAMRGGANGGRSKNYEPNSFGGPKQTGEPLYAGLASDGVSGATPSVRHAEDDDFVQAGMLYRVMKPDERERLVRNIAGGLARVSDAGIVERSIGHFSMADPEYGARIAALVKEARR